MIAGPGASYCWLLQLDSAKLLGFAPVCDTVSPPLQIEVVELLSLDDLIDYLYRLELGNEFLQGNEPLVTQVRKVLETRDISDLIAQLERVYRMDTEDEKPYAVKDILTGSDAGSRSVRDSFTARESIADNIKDNDAENFELLELAESLLEKLVELWEN